MTLKPGSQLGPYTLISAVGAGGMGEVYRARDSKLQRDVALKILPEQFVADPDRLARFRREAQALAALSHSNIAVIFDFQELLNSPFLVMEYVDGETLAQRLESGRIPIDDSLEVAKQIAEALSAAHEKGVVHRDLKPANVKITPEGKVKVLDFGLAKIFSEETSLSGLSQSPTIVSAASVAGTILGTAPYMSPEQARGKAVDKRTDVWAFGAVLYEMLTGRRAFEGEAATEVLGAIMHREPDWSLLPPDTPANVRRVLRRCLTKDLRQRLHDIADARVEIEAQEPDPANATAHEAPVSQRSWRQYWWLAASGIAAGLILGVTFSRWSQPSANATSTDARPSLLRATIDLPADAPLALATDVPGFGYNSPLVAVSPDGAWLTYVAQTARGRMLYVRDMSSGDVRELRGTEGAIHAFFSPDGQWIGFLTIDHVMKIPRQGGTVISICEANTPALAWWAPTGFIYFTETETYTLSRAPADGGKPERLLTSPDVMMTRFNDVLPDGETVLAEDSKGIGGDYGGIYLVDIRTRQTKLLIRPGYAARFVPPGYLLFARAGNLMAVRLDLSRGEVVGEPATVAAGVAMESLFGMLHAGASAGLAAFVPGGDLSLGKLAWIDRRGSVEYLNAPERVYGVVDLAPGDARLAVHVADVNDYIWIWDILRQEGRRVVNQTAEGFPRWSRDGRRLAGRTAARAGTLSGFVHDVEPSGAVSEGRVLENVAGRVASWSPQGDVLAIGLSVPNRIQFVSPGKQLDVPGFEATFADFSPDGRWLVYQSAQTGTAEIFVRSYPEGKVVGQVSTGGGLEPRWRSSGEVFYRNGGRWFSTRVSTDPQPRWDPPRLAFDTEFIDTPGLSYDISRDGQRLLVVKRAQPVSQSKIGVVVNWAQVLSAAVRK